MNLIGSWEQSAKSFSGKSHFGRFPFVVLLASSGAAQTFIHPGCLSTSNDLARMKGKVAASAQPWKGSWDRLVGNTDNWLNHTPEAVSTVNVGGGLPENYIRLARDSARGYQLALRYQISGDTRFGNKSVSENPGAGLCRPRPVAAGFTFLARWSFRHACGSFEGVTARVQPSLRDSISFPAQLGYFRKSLRDNCDSDAQSNFRKALSLAWRFHPPHETQHPVAADVRRRIADAVRFVRLLTSAARTGMRLSG